MRNNVPPHYFLKTIPDDLPRLIEGMSDISLQASDSAPTPGVRQSGICRRRRRLRWTSSEMFSRLLSAILYFCLLQI